MCFDCRLSIVLLIDVVNAQCLDTLPASLAACVVLHRRNHHGLRRCFGMPHFVDLFKPNVQHALSECRLILD
jgi:hypothetical protein